MLLKATLNLQNRREFILVKPGLFSAGGPMHPLFLAPGSAARNGGVLAGPGKTTLFPSQRIKRAYL